MTYAPAPAASSARSVAAGVGAVAVGALAFADAESGPTLCLFRRCTGGYCPGCGGTRAVAALFRGDVSRALSLHPVAVLLVVQAVLALLWLAATPGSAWAWLRAHSQQIAVANTVVLLAVWPLRLALGAIPAPFA